MKTRAGDNGQGDAQARFRDKEMARLRREGKALRSANEVLKKHCDRLRAGGNSLMVYRFIQANLGERGVSEMVAHSPRKSPAPRGCAPIPLSIPGALS